MRKYLIPLLMASALVPAAALADEGGFGRARTHVERSDSQDNSSADRPQSPRRIEHSNDGGPRVQVERPERVFRAERSVEQGQASEPMRVHRFEPNQGNAPVEQVRRFERHQTEQPTQQVERAERHHDGFFGRIQQTGRDEQVRQQDEVQVHRDRDGFSGLRDRVVQNGDHVDRHHHWSRDWRNDHRYDWYSYRSRYGSLYRLGRYYDPYGWNYRRFSIGFNLWPSYFGSNYWLNDPWQYRLPPAYGPYRWVRYYDDALLVNIYTGQVVDVIHDFFW